MKTKETTQFQLRGGIFWENYLRPGAICRLGVGVPTPGFRGLHLPVISLRAGKGVSHLAFHLLLEFIMVELMMVVSIVDFPRVRPRAGAAEVVLLQHQPRRDQRLVAEGFVRRMFPDVGHHHHQSLYNTVQEKQPRCTVGNADRLGEY